jgi:hypothetical protein
VSIVTFTMGQSRKRDTKRKWKRPQSVSVEMKPFQTKIAVPRIPQGDQLSHPTHRQVARLISYLGRPCHISEIVDKMTDVVCSSKEGNDCKMNSNTPKIGKTPIIWIQTILSDILGTVSLNEVPCIDLKSCSSHGFIVECILNRRSSKVTKQRINQESDMSETIPLIKCKHEGIDNQWSTVILILPHASMFYVAHQGGNQKSSKECLSGMPLSWLRLRKNNGQPALGGFIRSISRSFEVVLGNHPPRRTIHCYQFNDFEAGTPLLPPDRYENVVMHSTEKSRSFYNNEIKNGEKCGSFRYGCRRYIKGAHHLNLGHNVLKYDARAHGDIQFSITLRDSQGRPQDVSYIQVVQVMDHVLIDHLVTGSKLLKGKPGNCRQHNHDCGKMFATGEMQIAGVGIATTKITHHLASDDLLSRINKSSSNFAEQKLLSVLPTMQHMEKMAGRTASLEMGALFSPSCSMNISSNLGNATHYDVGDGSVGYSIWVETKQDTASNWYFVLPNVLIRYNGQTYNGLAIQLFHGVAISWDGRVIRHGTSITNPGCNSNECFGWFWSSDLRATKAIINEGNT